MRICKRESEAQEQFNERAKKLYELKFSWDDQEEAAYRGTISHIQNGYLKVWKGESETQEQFHERAKFLYSKQMDFITNNRGSSIELNTFPF